MACHADASTAQVRIPLAARGGVGLRAARPAGARDEGRAREASGHAAAAASWVSAALRRVGWREIGVWCARTGACAGSLSPSRHATPRMMRCARGMLARPADWHAAAAAWSGWRDADAGCGKRVERGRFACAGIIARAIAVGVARGCELCVCVRFEKEKSRFTPRPLLPASGRVYVPAVAIWSWWPYGLGLRRLWAVWDALTTSH